MIAKGFSLRPKNVRYIGSMLLDRVAAAQCLGAEAPAHLVQRRIDTGWVARVLEQAQLLSLIHIYYTPPTIPWQYTLNGAVFYNFMQHYMLKFAIYNLANRRNLENDYPYYGNDFLTIIPPRSYDLTFSAKF